MAVTKGQHISRFYSLALGRDNNFAARTDGLIGQAQSSPSVLLWSLLYANNSATAYISNLSDGREGQLVKIFNLGSDLYLIPSSVLKVSDSSPLAKDESVELVMHNSIWYEQGRSHSSSDQGIATATQADTTPSVKNLVTLIVANSAAVTITNFDDGYEGQRIMVLCYGSAFTLDTATSTNIVNVGSAGNYAVLSNSTIQLTRYKSKWWCQVEPKTG